MNENEKNKMNIALITYHRMKKGISLENLSNDLHISKGFLSEILNGKKKIKEDFFKQAMLSMNINYLYDEEPFNLLKEYIIEIYKAFVVSNLKKLKESQN